MITDALTPEAFEQALRAKGAYYHIHHPYHKAMHNGEATREQIQGWVANRFYYQTTIPLKDAAIMANCPDPATRRKWVQRILDHDGSHDREGGIEAWLQLGEAVGLTRCCRNSTCCPACGLPLTPMSILPAALTGRKRRAVR